MSPIRTQAAGPFRDGSGRERLVVGGAANNVDSEQVPVSEMRVSAC